MKKLLSAVTSVAMSLTLMAGAFASSVSAAGSVSAAQPNVSMGEVLDVSANRTAADGKVEWLIPTVTAAPGQTVTMPVVVKSSSLAVAGAQFKLDAAAPVSFSSKTDGDAYGSSIVYNKGKFAFGQGAGRGIVAADDSVVVTVAYTVPADCAEGTYAVKWSEPFASDTDGNNITEKVTFTDGAIIVKKAPANGKISWVLDKVTAAPGEVVTLKATVSAPDNAALSVAGGQFKIENDSAVEYSSVTSGGAYLSPVVANDDKKSFAFGNATGVGVIASDNATIASFTFKVPSTCAEGTYPVKWANGFVSDTDGKDITSNVTFVDGSITVKNTPTVDGKVKWVLDNVKANKGETVTLKAVVDDSAKAAVPVAGAQFKINADTVKYSKIADGTAYGAPVTANDAKQSFAFGNAAGSGVAAADGATIFTLTFTVPADCADGKYPVKWSDAFVSDTDGRNITSNVIFEDGSITVGSVDGAVEWVIPKVQAERGATVALDVYVKGDSDLKVSGAQFDIKGTAPTTYKDASGTPYGNSLVKNNDKMHFAFASADGEGKPAYDGDKIASLIFTVPVDCPKGQYPVTWSKQFVSDTNGSDITSNVTFTDGWIEVVDVLTTTTPGPTTTTTTTTVTAPEGGIMWQIATVTAYPGETVKLPIKVVDKEGTRLAIAGAQFDIQNREGVNYFNIEGSDAYGASITANPLKKKFDFANAAGVQAAANDGDNVAVLTYTVPEGTAPGRYPVDFVDGTLKIFDTNGKDISDLIIGVNGAIIVSNPDVTTTTTTTGPDVTTTTTTSGPVEPGNTTTTTSGPVEPGNTTTTTSGPVEPGNTTTTTSGPVEPGNTTTTTSGPVEPGNTTTTTSGPVEPGNTTTTTSGPVEPGNTTTTTSGPVEPGNTTTTTSGPVEPGNTTTTTSGPVEPGNTTTTSNVNPIITTTPIVVPKDSIAWVVDTVTAYPGEEVKVSIKVKDPNGSNLAIAGAQFKVTPDGKVELVKAGDKSGYGADIVPSADGYKFVFADGTGTAHVAPDGSVVIDLTYKVGEDVAPGTVIPISIKDLFVSDADGNDITKYVMPVDGAIYVVQPPVPTTTTTSGPVNGTTTTSGPVDGTTTTSGPVDGTTTTSGPVDGTTTTSGPVDGTTTTSGPVDVTTTTSGPVDGTTTTSGPVDVTTTTSGPVDGTTTTTGPVDGTTTTTGPVDVTTTTSGPVDGTTTTSGPVDVTTTTSGPVDGTTTTTGPVDVTTTTSGPVDGTTTTTGPVDVTTTTTEPGYKSSYAVLETQVGYYFSHDDGVRANGQPGGFNKEQVKTLKIVDVFEDGTEKERTDIDMSQINFNGLTPEGAYNGRTHIKGQTTITDFKYDIPVYYGSMALTDKSGKALTVTAYIGVKGDATLNNTVDASDASAVLSYYASVQTNGNTGDTVKLQTTDTGLQVSSPIDELDQLAAFLGDVNENEWSADNWKKRKTERSLNASDASNILAYYAKRQSSDNDALSNSDIWNSVLGDARFGG